MKVIGLIPARLNSTRLPRKPLLEIDGLPLIIHTLKRSMLAKKLDELAVCTDSKEIKTVVENYGGKCFLTSSNHVNGTDRIAEVAKKVNYDLIIDIQGDEPLLDFNHIDEVVDFHISNMKFDIIIPHLDFQSPESPNIVKLLIDKNNYIKYMSRAIIPYPFLKKPKFYKKHLSIISFKSESLQRYASLKQSKLEKIESIELLRALENDFSLGSFGLSGDSFSIDVKEDFENALKVMPKDKYRKLY
tara:strand:+ start:117 stop:851 length:735 start_codon:yes stop_codon:yes gene_type:complete